MKKIIGFAFIILALGMFSCNNQSEDVNITDLSEELSLKSAEISVAEVQAEAATTESTYEVEFFANAEKTLTKWWKIGKRFKWNQKLRYRINQCPDVTIEEGENDGYPKEITLNYGDSTVLNNGKVLSGIIVIEISAPRDSQEYKREISYMDFSIDSLLVNGTTEMEIDKVDEHFRKAESNLTFTLADGTIITRTSERIWQWIAGLDTEDDQTDDVFTVSSEVEATVNWTDGTSDSYKKETTTPLKRIAGCRYFIEGVVEVTIGGELVSVLDYGYAESDEECDQYALLTNSEYPDGEVIDLSEKKYKNKKERNKENNQNGNGQNGNG